MSSGDGWAPLAPACDAVAVGWEARGDLPQDSKHKLKVDSHGKHKNKGKPKGRRIAKHPSSSQETDPRPPIEPEWKQMQENEGPSRPDDGATLKLPEGCNATWDGTDCTVEFQQNATIFVQGRVEVELLQGKVCILGYQLKVGSSVFIESPRWFYATDLVANTHSSVCLRSARACSSLQEATFIIGVDDDPRLIPIILPTSWTDAVNGFVEELALLQRATVTGSKSRASDDSPTSRVVVCGAKGFGKSTCLRYLTNSLLGRGSKVAILDCDVGQPELSPPGILSLSVVETPLLSPPSQHMMITKRHVAACFVGHVRSNANPVMFLASIRRLVQAYSKLVREAYSGDESNLPLLVNSDGWLKGLGHEIFASLVGLVAPSHVFHLVKDVTNPFLDVSGTFPQNATVHTLEPVGSRNGGQQVVVSPADLRSLRLCSYFVNDRQVWSDISFGSNGVVDSRNVIGTRLAAACPFAVSLDLVRLRVSGDSDLSQESSILDAFNGSIVGLCRRSDTSTVETEGTLLCLGLGIIRSIDRTNRVLFVLTPTPEEALDLVDEIVLSAMQPPLNFYDRELYADSFLYQSCDGVSSGVGGNAMKSRRNIQRIPKPV